MKKIIIAVILTVLSISTITFGLGTVYFYKETTNAEDKISNLEDDIKELESSLETFKNENTSSSNNNYEGEENTSEEEPVYNEQSSYSNLKVISFNELNTLINNKETFILLISQTYCSHCIEYKPELNEILKKHSLSAYVIEYDLLSSEDIVSFKAITSLDYTPTTTFFKNGIEDTKNRFVGDLGESVVEANLKQAGFIK